MSRLSRFWIGFFALLILLFSSLSILYCLQVFWDIRLFAGLGAWLPKDADWLHILFVVLLVMLWLGSILSLTLLRRSGRLNRSPLKQNDIGQIDISGLALESVALNSARAAQVGIKTAKARVYSAKEGRLKIVLAVVLYSDIEIPSQMHKIQERVKKDVERYTGLTVEQVLISVTQVELVGARVER